MATQTHVVLFLVIVLGCVSGAKRKPVTPSTEDTYRARSSGNCDENTCKPENIHMTEATSQSMTIQWNSPRCLSNHDMYKVKLVGGPQSSGSFSVTATCSQDICEILLDYYNVPISLFSCTDYTVSVRPDEYSVGGMDCEATGEAQTGPPQPKNFRTFDMSPTSAFLKWEVPQDSGSCVSGYELTAQLDAVPVGLEKLVGNFTSVANVPSCTDCKFEMTDLQACTEYRFNIRSLSNSNGAYSDIATETDRTLVGPPGTVGNFTGKTTSEQQVELTWTKPTQNGLCVTGYDISYTCDSGYNISCQIRKVYVNGADQTSAVVDGLKQCTPYHFIIGARTWENDINGQTTNVTLQTSSEAPGQPSNVKLVDTAFSFVTISWSPPKTTSSCKVIMYHITCSGGSSSSRTTNNSTSSAYNSCPCDSGEVCVCTADTKANIGCPESEAPKGARCLKETTEYRCGVRAYNGMWGESSSKISAETDRDGLSGGAIAGIVICVLLGVVLLVILVIFIIKVTKTNKRKRRSRKSRDRHRRSSYEPAQTHDVTYTETKPQEKKRDSSSEGE